MEHPMQRQSERMGERVCGVFERKEKGLEKAASSAL